jgi:dihydroneopterin triphosphate diphosphatase
LKEVLRNLKPSANCLESVEPAKPWKSGNRLLKTMPSVECTIVELCVFKRTKKGPLFLLLKRSSEEKLYPNMWQIITGKIKRAEKAMHAALRELYEETSLPVRRFWVAPIVGSFFDPVANKVQMCPLFAVEVASTAMPALSKEHQQYEWATAKRVRELLVWPGHLEAVQIVQKYIVAGREAAILTELKPQLQKGK